MRRVILLGFMGAGKTTLGKALSKKIGLPFYDLDTYIECQVHKTVRQFFDEQGEVEFRHIERDMLREVAEFENVVISCGGGTPCFFDNMEYMNRQGDTVYLRTTPETILKHLAMSKVERPLLANKSREETLDFITGELAKRESCYQQAEYTLDVSVMDTYEKIQLFTRELCGLLYITGTRNEEMDS